MNNKLKKLYSAVKIARQERVYCGLSKYHAITVRRYNRAERQLTKTHLKTLQ